MPRHSAGRKPIDERMRLYKRGVHPTQRSVDHQRGGISSSHIATVPGRVLALTGVFTRVDAPKVMEFRLTESRFPAATTDTLEEVAGGTRYTCHVSGDPAFGGRLGRLVDVLVSKAPQRALAKHLARLPAHIDSWTLEKG